MSEQKKSMIEKVKDSKSPKSLQILRDLSVETLIKRADDNHDLGALNELGFRLFETNTVKDKDKEKVRVLFQLLADRGSAHAQYNLALCYSGGIGIVRDAKEAVRMYQLAADQKLVQARSNLAICYTKGIGVPQDLKKAVELYQLAVEQGSALAQNNLAYCYEKGIGVKEDTKEAVRLYRLAAEQGVVQSQGNLALCYEKGIGVKEDINEAVKWWRRAAAQGHVKGNEKLRNSKLEVIRKVEKEEEADLWRLIVRKQFASNQESRTEIQEEISSLLAQSPNKHWTGDFTPGPNIDLAKKLPFFEKKVLELIAQLESFVPPLVLIKIIINYDVCKTPKETSIVDVLSNTFFGGSSQTNIQPVNESTSPIKSNENKLSPLT